LRPKIFPTKKWETRQPIEFGVDVNAILSALKCLKKNYPEYKSLYLFKDGYLVFKDVNENPRENIVSRFISKVFLLSTRIYNVSRYTVIDNIGDLWNVRSVTKSIISLLIGIAIDKGFISSLEDRISDFIC
jgi:hypothetical protein